MKILCSNRAYEMSIMGKVTDQLDWELQRGKIEVDDITIEYIEDIAERKLTEDEFVDFLNYRLATEVYQSY